MVGAAPPPAGGGQNTGMRIHYLLPACANACAPAAGAGNAVRGLSAQARRSRRCAVSKATRSASSTATRCGSRRTTAARRSCCGWWASMPPRSASPSPEARAALQELVQGQPLRLETAGRDTMADRWAILYAGTRNLNRTMVQEGHAWSTRCWGMTAGPAVADERTPRRWAAASTAGRYGDAARLPARAWALFRRRRRRWRRRKVGGALGNARPAAGRCERRKLLSLRRVVVALRADELVCGGHLVPAQLPRRTDGRQPRRRALRAAVVPAMSPPA